MQSGMKPGGLYAHLWMQLVAWMGWQLLFAFGGQDRALLYKIMKDG